MHKASHNTIGLIASLNRRRTTNRSSTIASSGIATACGLASIARIKQIVATMNDPTGERCSSIGSGSSSVGVSAASVVVVVVSTTGATGVGSTTGGDSGGASTFADEIPCAYRKY